MRWYYQRALRQAERIEAALEEADEKRRDDLAVATKLLTLAVHPNTPEAEAVSARAKAEELIAAHADAAASGVSASALVACNANWDKASEHAARAAPYVHHKLVAVDKKDARKPSEMSDEELLAAAEDAEAELASLSDGEKEMLDDAVRELTDEREAA